jgi:4-amino-4-deoxy-L-arabinose transferase-like glycosyltransferase
VAAGLRIDGVPAGQPIATLAATDVSGAGPRARVRTERAILAATTLGIGAVCAQGLWRATLWHSAEPRVMVVARDQFAHGLVRSLTLADMPFLEEPPFYFDATAAAFHVAGGASILAARVVVALFAMLWVAAVVLAVRRAAGARAGLLAGALLCVAPGFATLARRLGVDVALVAMISLAMLFLFMAVDDDRDRIDGRWWWAGLVATGCAALTKGLFGTFLFVTPTLAYAALARDRRIVAALLRPASIALLLLPHVLWGLVLFHAGGTTFVFEHFVNNTLGRVLHHRFTVAGTDALPYGDVGPAYAWHHSLSEVLLGALPAALVVPFAVAQQHARGGFSARDAQSRLLALALCWACVPPILLTFSAYKGRGHLGASSAALVVVAALWLARGLRRGGADVDPAPRWTRVGVAGVYALAPVLLAAEFFGLPATPTGARIVLAGVAAIAATGATAALVSRLRGAAVDFVLAGLAVSYVADFSPGANLEDDGARSIDAVAKWVAHEAGDAPIGVYFPRVDVKRDDIGLADEQAVATLTYWSGRPVTVLRTPDQTDAFLRQSAPAYFVSCTPKGTTSAWLSREDAVGWSAAGGNRGDAYTLVANRAAALRRASPSEPPPIVEAASPR